MTGYASTDRIKRRAGVDADDLGTDDSEFDDLVDELNEMASEVVDDYCDRDFALHEETVELDGSGRDSLLLPGYPVREVHEVEVSGNQLDADEYRVRDDVKGENGGVLERRHMIFPDGWENVRVEYDWGFEEPPGAVRSVAEQLVIEAVQSAKKDQSLSGADSISLDGFSVSFSAEALTMGLTDAQRTLLDKHKRVSIA